jgi:acyl carrier protein
MNDKNEMSDQIYNFILARFPLARKAKFNHKTPLLESGLVDSQGILDVVGFVEQEFGVVLSDDELVPENFQTIAHLATFLGKKRSAPHCS